MRNAGCRGWVWTINTVPRGSLRSPRAIVVAAPAGTHSNRGQGKSFRSDPKDAPAGPASSRQVNQRFVRLRYALQGYGRKGLKGRFKRSRGVKMCRFMERIAPAKPAAAKSGSRRWRGDPRVICPVQSTPGFLRSPGLKCLARFAGSRNRRLNAIANRNL